MKPTGSMQKPLVSIIIPAFNEEKVIGQLLGSIKKQTYKKIETIVVDDASTDNTVEISKKYTKKVYRRVHAERSVQRNFGAKKSKGSILFFLDADMVLSGNVVKDAVKKKKDYKALVIPEKTTGDGFLQSVRRFEREMYEHDKSIEVARVFDRDVFFELKGYDEELTGPEDYDLPYRIGKKYKIGRGTEYLLHNEGRLNLVKLLKKRFYYANKGALYAQKHPELVMTQGNLLFRSAYLRNWKKFIRNPVLGFSFLIIKCLETIAAILGFIKAVGIKGFLKTAKASLKK
jgi:glycosyltransferase involved in cell wall biosynthesis